MCSKESVASLTHIYKHIHANTYTPIKKGNNNFRRAMATLYPFYHPPQPFMHHLFSKKEKEDNKLKETSNQGLVSIKSPKK
jgi:hypothetical protein